jgi:glycosyltransferase involved in cell wall biosynthesis
MNILFITQKFPYPLNDGGNIRSFHILKQLAKEHSVTLLSTYSGPAEQADWGELPRLCAKISTFAEKPGSGLLLAKSLLYSLFSDQPYFMYKNFSPELLTGIQDELRRGAYQAIHFNHLDTTQYIDHLPGGLISVLDTHNILSLLIERFYQQERNPVKKKYIYIQWQKTRRLEQQMFQRMSRCLACSDKDAHQLNDLAPKARVEVIPNGVALDRPSLPPTADNPSLVFIGAMDYLPNYQGVLYFCEQVLPQIEQEIPDIKLNIIGRNPNPLVRRLAQNPNISVLAEVDNIYDHLHPEQILVVPLTIGGGTRLKILDAMSLKLPIVSTSVGAEGLEVTPGEHILIADEPYKMAQQIVMLYKDKALREKLTQNAYQLIEQKYEWNIIGEKLLRVYRELG